MSESIGKANFVKDVRKKLSRLHTLDRLKEEFDNEIKNSAKHQALFQELAKLSTEPKTFGEICLELGGDELKSKVTDANNLEDILEVLVNSDKVRLPDECKNRIQRSWDNILMTEAMNPQ